MTEYWKSEIKVYNERISVLERSMAGDLYSLQYLKTGPRFEDEPITELDICLNQSSWYFKTGAWERLCEIVESLLYLWRKGRFSSGAVLARLSFELWAASYYLQYQHEQCINNFDFEKLKLNVSKFFEGARSDVLMFYGEPATQKPVHILDMVRNLKEQHLTAEADYEFLCESCHPNFPRYLEWYVIDHRRDNWRNKTARKRGHLLLDRTLTIVEHSVAGCRIACADGLRYCDEIFKKHSNTMQRIANKSGSH
jgi:hypothetical protein